jgi:hypothetical protein
MPDKKKIGANWSTCAHARLTNILHIYVTPNMAAWKIHSF